MVVSPRKLVLTGLSNLPHLPRNKDAQSPSAPPPPVDRADIPCKARRYRLTKLVQEGKSLNPDTGPASLRAINPSGCTVSIWSSSGDNVKLNVTHVASREPVKRTAFPSELGVSRAVRLPRFCGRHSCASRPSPGLASWGRLWTRSQALLPSLPPERMRPREAVTTTTAHHRNFCPAKRRASFA